MTDIVYLNGEYKAIEQATVSVMDRGFLFGDGVYEVIPVFGNRLLRQAGHMARLQNSLDRVSLPNPRTAQDWTEIFAELLEKNPGGDRAIYLQISRGAYPVRDLKISADDIPATVFCKVLHIPVPDIDVLSAGIRVITVEDFRWQACDIKSTSLVANVMLKQQASDAGVDDAVLLKDGRVTEGTASNVFLVKAGVLITPPVGKKLLSGITRDLVIEIAKNNAILVEQRDVSEDELRHADEVWMTSSTREIAPVISVDGEPVGSGRAGPLWKKMMDLYQQNKQQLRTGQSEL